MRFLLVILTYFWSLDSSMNASKQDYYWYSESKELLYLTHGILNFTIYSLMSTISSKFSWFEWPDLEIISAIYGTLLNIILSTSVLNYCIFSIMILSSAIFNSQVTNSMYLVFFLFNNYSIEINTAFS
jgi:hypothetical protein